MAIRIWAKLSDFVCDYLHTYPANFIETTDTVPEIRQF